MLGIGDYLDLDARTTHDQWVSVTARPWPAAGRQVDFLPVETLLCLAASLLVNHRHFGGSTSHRAEEPVPTLARLFKRPNSSVLAKMANLDGSRSNGAKHEIEVASKILSAPGELARIYRVILSSARGSGIEAETLPDFLGLENQPGDLRLLGQEKLWDSDVETAVQARVERWMLLRDDLDTRVTERLLVAAARVGQHRFAQRVLINHGHRCVFCGLAVSSGGVPASRMLVASHIKAWRASSPAERLDHRNGLAACPSHDVAFDTGLITVNGGLRIHVRPHLCRAAEADAAVSGVFGRPPLALRLLLPPGAAEPHSSYLAWHNRETGWAEGDLTG